MMVGTKVVCIDDNFPSAVYQHYLALPEEGVVYVLRSIRPGISYDLKPEISVTLVGLQNPLSETPPFPERGFNMERFRPLDEVKEEVSQEELVGAFGENYS